MTVERAFLWLAEVVMTFAFVCFVVAFRVRKSDNARHRWWAQVGTYSVFAGLVAVELVARVLDWTFPIRSRAMFHAHLVVASATLVLLVVLLVTGLFRLRRLHVHLYWLFFPLYVLTVVFSWFAFELV